MLSLSSLKRPSSAGKKNAIKQPPPPIKHPRDVPVMFVFVEKLLMAAL